MSRVAASRHAENAHYCSCGKVVFGNGGKAGHEYKHERAKDGHTWIMRSAWDALDGEYDREKHTKVLR